MAPSHSVTLKVKAKVTQISKALYLVMELDHMLILNINRKSYMESSVALPR